jgi:hypothetical protein
MVFMTVNPYESPIPVKLEGPAAELRRPAFGTFLIYLWFIEGGFKAFVVIAALSRGVDFLEVLAAEYSTWNRFVFFLVSWFFIVETIGPWIGIYYLTGRRARTIPLERALLQILMTAGGSTAVGVLVLMSYLELAS